MRVFVGELLRERERVREWLNYKLPMRESERFAKEVEYLRRV